MANPTDAPSTTTAQKTAYGIPIRNLWYLLLYAWKETPRSPYWHLVDTVESPSLDGLLASILVKIVQQRLRIGLGCSYMAEQQLLRGVRGRIHFTNSVKHRAFERGQAFCEFEQFSINAPKNQIIRSTLFHLAQVGQFGPDQKQAKKLRHAIRWLVRTLDGIDLIELTPDFIHREQANRHDHDYRLMLAMCDLILQRRLPTEEAGQAYTSQLEREQQILHRLYERFVANFYQYHLSDWKVQPQRTLGWHEQSPNPYLPIMRPDLILQDNASGRIIILDTKFTAKSLKENQWGKAMFDSSHLYQIYTYLKTQAHRSEHHQQATGILLYPAIHETLSEKVTLQEHQIRIACVDLAVPWPHIEQRLLDVIEEAS
ncbi:MAG: hypothetical protein KDJ52_10050 [Anaerolineae bacterium]|nr:hypothetical protein [Anaerolineae bacterium]